MEEKNQSMEKRLLFLVGWVGCMSGTSLVYAQFLSSGCVYPYHGTSPFVCMEWYSAAHYLAILVSRSARDMPLILIMTDLFLFALWLTGNGPLRQGNRALVLSLGLGTLQAQTPVNSPRMELHPDSAGPMGRFVQYNTVRYGTTNPTGTGSMHVPHRNRKNRSQKTLRLWEI
jgi:hypothetical protein